MSQSLSVILPVSNAEHQLARRVEELLEVTTELTSRLELLIVDDGSTDSTEEVAMDLCRVYPQVNVIRYSKKLGRIGAIRAGMSQTTGDLVLLHDMSSPVSSEAIRQFWEMRNDQELVLARSEASHAAPTPYSAKAASWSGSQMLRREAVDELQGRPRAKVDRVTRTDLADGAGQRNSLLRELAGARDAMEPS